MAFTSKFGAWAILIILSPSLLNTYARFFPSTDAFNSLGKGTESRFLMLV
jgi:hypothetical protein